MTCPVLIAPAMNTRMWEHKATQRNLATCRDDLGYEIEEPVDAVSDVSLTVLGVKFALDANTMFEGGMPAPDDYVEVEDDNGDGTADSVEIED